MCGDTPAYQPTRTTSSRVWIHGASGWGIPRAESGRCMTMGADPGVPDMGVVTVGDMQGCAAPRGQS